MADMEYLSMYVDNWDLGGSCLDHMQAIRAFARVVETGGFHPCRGLAADANATVSKQIQQLERHLGVKLLERTNATRPCHERRSRLLRADASSLAELDEIDRRWVGANQARGRLRVDTGGSTATIF